MENATNNETTETTAKNLYDRLKKATERKEPGSSFSQNGQGSSTQKKASDYWNKDDFSQTNSNNTQEQNQPVNNPNYATPEQKKASAEITVGGIDTLEHLVFRFIINYKFKTKFTDDEIVKLDTVTYKEPALMNNAEKQLWNKWDHLMKKRDAQILKLPMHENDKNNMVQQFISYQDLKQKLLSPAWGIGISIAKSIAEKAIDTFMD